MGIERENFAAFLNQLSTTDNVKGYQPKNPKEIQLLKAAREALPKSTATSNMTNSELQAFYKILGGRISQDQGATIIGFRVNNLAKEVVAAKQWQDVGASAANAANTTAPPSASHSVVNAPAPAPHTDSEVATTKFSTATTHQGSIGSPAKTRAIQNAIAAPTKAAGPLPRSQPMQASILTPTKAAGPLPKVTEPLPKAAGPLPNTAGSLSKAAVPSTTSEAPPTISESAQQDRTRLNQLDRELRSLSLAGEKEARRRDEKKPVLRAFIQTLSPHDIVLLSTSKSAAKGESPPFTQLIKDYADVFAEMTPAQLGALAKRNDLHQDLINVINRIPHHDLTTEEGCQLHYETFANMIDSATPQFEKELRSRATQLSTSVTPGSLHPELDGMLQAQLDNSIKKNAIKPKVDRIILINKRILTDYPQLEESKKRNIEERVAQLMELKANLSERSSNGKQLTQSFNSLNTQSLSDMREYPAIVSTAAPVKKQFEVEAEKLQQKFAQERQQAASQQARLAEEEASKPPLTQEESLAILHKKEHYSTYAMIASHIQKGSLEPFIQTLGAADLQDLWRMETRNVGASDDRTARIKAILPTLSDNQLRTSLNLESFRSVLGANGVTVANTLSVPQFGIVAAATRNTDDLTMVKDMLNNLELENSKKREDKLRALCDNLPAETMKIPEGMFGADRTTRQGVITDMKRNFNIACQNLEAADELKKLFNERFE